MDTNKEVIIVWKDGNHKNVPRNSAWEYENDENWLVTIDTQTLDCE